MGLRDLFRRKPTLFGDQSPPVAAKPIPLSRAPAYQPVPVNAATPLDAEVARLWLAYQRSTSSPTWAGFIAALTAANADLTEQVRRARNDLKDYRSWGLFKP